MHDDQGARTITPTKVVTKRKRVIYDEPDEARQKKRIQDNQAHAGRRKFEEDCRQVISIFSPEEGSRDAYHSITEHRPSWHGTIQEEISQNHLAVDALARAPYNPQRALAEKLLDVHTGNKYAAFTAILSLNPRVEELRVVTSDTPKILQELQTPCPIPILITAHPTPQFSIEDLLNQVSKFKDAKIEVFDPSVSDYQEATRGASVEEFIKAFSKDAPTAAPLNFLDINNTTGIQFLLSGVITGCLETKCQVRSRQQAGVDSLGKNSGEPGGIKIHPEFFIATKKGGISPQHVDNFGKMTCVMMLEGVKFWYMPAGDRDVIRRDHCGGDPAPGSAQLKIKLDVGKAFIQMPGQVHAVWSQTDCLMVGAHFYTAATFATSLDCIHEQFVGNIRSNEDASPDDWTTLTTIINSLHDRACFTEKESYRAYESLKNLNESPQLQSHFKSLKNGSKLQQALKRFQTAAKEVLKKWQALDGLGN